MNRAIHFHLPFPPQKMVLFRDYSALILSGIYVITVQEGGVSTPVQ